MQQVSDSALAWVEAPEKEIASGAKPEPKAYAARHGKPEPTGHAALHTHDDPSAFPVKRVLALCFDPFIIIKGKKKRNHEWLPEGQVPRDLAQQYISEMETVSHGCAKYRIAEWIELNEMPEAENGKSTPRGTYTAWLAGALDKGFWDAERPDLGGGRYNFATEKTLRRFRVQERVARGEIDEVWLFTGERLGPGVYESQMAGQGAYWCNAPALDGFTCKPFLVFGFNYEFPLGWMLENTCHAMESILDHFFGQPSDGAPYEKLSDWGRFTRCDRTAPGRSGVGTVHFAPNSRRDYDWGNPQVVHSYCADWAAYPNLTGKGMLVDANEWGGGDIRAHHAWWLGLIPHAAGKNDLSGMYNNWWRYYWGVGGSGSAAVNAQFT